MKERPILFSSSMIKAILADVKSQTRRVVKVHGSAPSGAFWDHGAYMPFEFLRGAWSFRDRTTKMHSARSSGAPAFRCPYGAAGDQLWVRETWAPRGVNKIGGGPLTTLIAYRADGAMHTLPHHEIARVAGEWKPSIFMPRWASRIALEITGVRVERLNEISEDDAIAEGAHRKIWITSPLSAGAMGARGDYGTHREGYKEIWEDINGGGTWALNPWVWCLSFKRITP